MSGGMPDALTIVSTAIHTAATYYAAAWQQLVPFVGKMWQVAREASGPWLAQAGQYLAVGFEQLKELATWLAEVRRRFSFDSAYEKNSPPPRSPCTMWSWRIRP